MYVLVTLKIVESFKFKYRSGASGTGVTRGVMSIPLSCFTRIHYVAFSLSPVKCYCTMSSSGTEPESEGSIPLCQATDFATQGNIFKENLKDGQDYTLLATIAVQNLMFIDLKLIETVRVRVVPS